MIYGIGIDVVQISRIEKAFERWGDRFLKRIFTLSEIEYCRDKPNAAARFALRFAAKEAFAKALGLGMGQGLTFQQIEVVKGSHGNPHLSLHGRSRELYEQRGITGSFISLSDDGPCAVAVVVLEA